MTEFGLGPGSQSKALTQTVPETGEEAIKASPKVKDRTGNQTDPFDGTAIQR